MFPFCIEKKEKKKREEILSLFNIVGIFSLPRRSQDNASIGVRTVDLHGVTYPNCRVCITPSGEYCLRNHNPYISTESIDDLVHMDDPVGVSTRQIWSRMKK